MKPPLLPCLSGLLLALSLPPVGADLLAFVALIPFALFVVRAAPTPAGALEVVRGGVWLGVVFFGLLLHWIAFAFSERPWLGAAAYVVAVGVLALVPAFAAWVLHRGVHRFSAPLWLALPVAWTASEWLRAHLPGGLAFPWAGLGLSLTGRPQALALAEWAGERGVTFWIALVGGLLAEAARRAWRGSTPGWTPTSRPLAWAGPALAAVLVAVIPAAWGAVRPADPTGPTLRVAVVQTAVPRSVRRRPLEGAQAMSAALDRVLAELEPGSADLVVLPEAAFPIALELPAGQPYLTRLQTHARRLGAPLLVGGLGVEATEDGASEPAAYNSVFLVDGGGVRARYDKRHLVPGVERAPFQLPSLVAAVRDTAVYAVGDARPLPRAAGVPLGPLICYEAAFAGLARAHLREGAGLLVNATNDGWFASGALGAAARAQHEAHLVLRAVEGRVGVVRSANEGVSLVVDPSGEVKTLAPLGSEAVRVERVRTAAGHTPFTRWGDVVGAGSALAAALLLVWPSRLGRVWAAHG